MRNPPPSAAGRRVAFPLAALGVVIAAGPWTTSEPDALRVALAGSTAIAAAVAWSIGLRREATYSAIAVTSFLIGSAVTPSTGSATLRGLAVGCAALVAPLAAAALGGRGTGLRMALAGGLVLGLGRMLLFDPFRDPGCVDCRANGLALAHLPWLATTCSMIGMLGVVVGLVITSRGSPRPWAIIATAPAAILTAASPRWADAIVSILLVSVTASVVRTVITRARLRRAVAALRQDDLRDVIGSRVGDPDLTVAFWLPDERRLGALDGGPPLPATASQSTTEIRTGSTLLAVVHHDGSSAGVRYLAELLDGPARLAVANQCLRAQLASHERALRASRRRLIEQWDVDRRRMERDIHDSAQHLVLSLGLEVQQAQANPDLDPLVRHDLERCLGLVRQALDELRGVSHGLYPPSLESRGLGPALTTLAMYSDGNLTIGRMPDRRLPAAVERTVIALVADLATAGSPLHVDTELDDDDVRISWAGSATSQAERCWTGSTCWTERSCAAPTASRP